MAITPWKGVSDGDLDGLVSDEFVLDTSWHSEGVHSFGGIKAIYFHLWYFTLSLSNISIDSFINFPKTHTLQLCKSTHLGYIDATLNLEQYWCTISRTITKVLSRKNSKSLNHTRGLIALILYFPLKKEDHCTGSRKEREGPFETVFLLATVIKPSVSIPPKSLLIDNAFLSKVNCHTNTHK